MVASAPATPVPGWTRWVPGVQLARSYQRSWLRHDIGAGIVLTALLVPAGMGYAEAAGLPAVNGLYATIIPLLAYAIVGPSRILVLGPDSSLVPLIAIAILPVVANESEAVAAAGLLAILTGLICVAAGVARFGFLTDLLSAPVRYGYLNGIALTVIVSQIPKLLGFSTDATGFVDEVRALVDGIADGLTNGTALALGLGAIAIILIMRALTPRWPGVLVAVVAALVVVPLFGLADEGISLVGTLPQGLPSPSIPTVEWGDLPDLGAAAFGIAIVAFADTSVLSRAFAIRGGYHVDSNQELVALGVANVAAGCFQGFAICSSSTRTPVAEAAGAKTQVTGVVGALLVIGLIVLVPGLFANLPQSVLAAVVITAAMRIVEIHKVARLWRRARSEFVLSLIAFLAVVLLGVLAGIGIAVAVSLLNFIRKAWRPHDATLVRVDGLKGYHDAERHPEGHAVPGLLLYRFDAPLFFANADFFRAQVLELVDESDPPPRWVVITAEPITSIDATAVDMLRELLGDLDRRGVLLAFAELKGHVRERLERYGLVDLIGPDHFYRTIGEVVKAYVASEDVPWTDWEDREQGNRDHGSP
jgi:high affinity sulfate transporter 1